MFIWNISGRSYSKRRHKNNYCCIVSLWEYDTENHIEKTEWRWKFREQRMGNAENFSVNF